MSHDLAVMLIISYSVSGACWAYLGWLWRQERKRAKSEEERYRAFAEAIRRQIEMSQKNR